MAIKDGDVSEVAWTKRSSRGLDAMKRISVGMIAWIFIILGASSIATAIFCAFFFSDGAMGGLWSMPYMARYPLEQYSPVFFVVGIVLLAVGWILRDYAIRPVR